MGTKYQRNKKVIFREEENEAILFNADSSDTIVINETGCLIWSLCEGNNTVENFVAKIIEEFDITPEKAKLDIENFITVLVKGCFLHEKT